MAKVQGKPDIQSVPAVGSLTAEQEQAVELFSVLFKEAVQCGGSATTGTSWNSQMSDFRSAQMWYTPMYSGCIRITNGGVTVHVPLANVKQFTVK